MIHREVELLAPAGSYEGFEAAIGAGADAVYLGGGSFGARAYAKNFEKEELLCAIRTAHIHQKKLYLTVNTLLKNREMQRELYEYLSPYYEAGLDAVIVQDMGVLSFIRRNFPDLLVHASTQMTVTGPQGMKFLQEKGVARVIPARELSLEEIAIMHRESPVEIECFIHGALCYSYSGQCLMSSILGGRSGNRGRCAQPCRLSYSVSADGRCYQGKEGFCPLSMKDICTLDILPRILEAGVTSLKIEGRMKQPAYSAGVVGIYRKYLDILIKEGPAGYEVRDEDRQRLLDIFSRGGSCRGYYQQHNGPDMLSFSNAKKTAGTLPGIRKIKEKLYGSLMLFPGSPAVLKISSNGQEVTVMGETVQPARNQPMTKERIRRQMEKLGNTEFFWESLDIQMDERIFIPVGSLNELRRNALREMGDALNRAGKRSLPNMAAYVGEKRQNSITGTTDLYVSCETLSQVKALEGNPDITGMYVPYPVMKSCMEAGLQKKKELYLAMPHIVRGGLPTGFMERILDWISDGMKGFLIRNLESYGLLRQAGLNSCCVLDHSMYTWNQEALSFWQKEGIMRDTIPLELNERELLHRDNLSSELCIYGYLPLMISAQCVNKNIFRCDRSEGTVYLKDRYDKVFPSVCYCDPWKTETTKAGECCYNIIYNSIPYGLLDESDRVHKLGAGAYRLSFTRESPREASAILREFASVYLHGGRPGGHSFTRGHFNRGAE